MVSYFQNVPERDSTVHIRADPWPRFTMKEAGRAGGSPVFFKDKGWLRISITSFLSKILEICLGELSIVR